MVVTGIIMAVAEATYQKRRLNIGLISLKTIRKETFKIKKINKVRMESDRCMGVHSKEKKFGKNIK